MNRLSNLLLLTALLLPGLLLPTSLQAQETDKKEAQDTPAKPATKKIDFHKQVWPLLEAKCVQCHQAAHVDENGRKRRPKGRVQLDDKAAMLKAKRGKLIIPKKSSRSILMEAIQLPADHEDRMPPKKKGPPLSKDEIGLLRRWIDEGANFGKWKSWADEKKKAEADKDKGKDAKPTPGKGADK